MAVYDIVKQKSDPPIAAKQYERDTEKQRESVFKPCRGVIGSSAIGKRSRSLSLAWSPPRPPSPNSLLHILSQASASTSRHLPSTLPQEKWQKVHSQDVQMVYLSLTF